MDSYFDTEAPPPPSIPNVHGRSQGKAMRGGSRFFKTRRIFNVGTSTIILALHRPSSRSYIYHGAETIDLMCSTQT